MSGERKLAVSSLGRPSIYIPTILLYARPYRYSYDAFIPAVVNHLIVLYNIHNSVYEIF